MTSTDPSRKYSELHSQLWTLQRDERQREAVDFLLSHLPLSPRPQEHQHRWLWRQLVELGLQWSLEHEGPLAADQRIQAQLQEGGLPADADELEAASSVLQREGLRNEELLCRLQLRALRHRQPDPQDEAAASQARTLRLAHLMAEAGWIDDAERTLSPLLRPETTSPEVWQLGGLLAYRRHQHAEAAQRLRACHDLQPRPSDPLAPLFLAKLDLDHGRLEAAAERLAALALQAPFTDQQTVQLRLLLWQQGLQSADIRFAVLLDLHHFLSNPHHSDSAGLVRLAPALLTDGASLKSFHQLLAALQTRLAVSRLTSGVASPWWEESSPSPSGSNGDSVTRPLKLAFLGGEEAELALPIGPPAAISQALAVHAVDAHWFDAASLGCTRSAVDRLRRERFDAVIDLIGWRAGHRQDCLRNRVAPLQLSWPADGIGLAAPWIDALLLDRFLAPAAELLPDAQLISQGSVICRGDLPSLAPPPRADSDGLVMGVLASPERISGQSLALWARLLIDQPEARILFAGPTYGERCVQANIRTSLASLGVIPSRVDFASVPASTGSPAALMALVAERFDVCLDPLPAGDALMALQSLWAGVPVVASRGEALHQKMTAGLLEQLGMADFVAADNDAYIEIATLLIQDGELRRDLRSQLRDQLQSALVTNVDQFAADLASALRSAQHDLSARRAATVMPWDRELDEAELEQLLRG